MSEQSGPGAVFASFNICSACDSLICCHQHSGIMLSQWWVLRLCEWGIVRCQKQSYDWHVANYCVYGITLLADS